MGKFLLKILDNFLKILKTDRNTFFTYLLSVFTLYILADRIIEVLFMIFTGISASYWGPIKYTFAFACPVFAFLFSFDSKFCKGANHRIKLVDIYATVLFMIFISMVIQWTNKLRMVYYSFSTKLH